MTTALDFFKTLSSCVHISSMTATGTVGWQLRSTAPMSLGPLAYIGVIILLHQNTSMSLQNCLEVPSCTILFSTSIIMQHQTKLMAWHCSLMVSQVFDSQNFRGEFDHHHHHHHHHHHPLNRGTFGMRNRGEKVSNCENYPSTTKHGTPKEPTVSQGISGFLVKHMKHQFNL